jgi:hypothetical protein
MLKLTLVKSCPHRYYAHYTVKVWHIVNAEIASVVVDVMWNVLILYFSAESESGREHMYVNSGNGEGGGGGGVLKLRLLSN